jgi:dihydrodipicolinate synthase/N-acetylneuraminate lyase
LTKSKNKSKSNCNCKSDCGFYNKFMLIEGIFAAVPTPFYPDERVYLRKVEANIAHYSRTLLSGLLLLGSTGEAVMLDDRESREVLRVAAEAAAPDRVLIAGVARESVKGTVELAEAAAKFGYDAVLVRTPTYFANQMTAAALLHYFRSVADRSPLPVLIYNIPQFAPYNIPVELVAELAGHPNIIGIKDSTGSVERIRSLVEGVKNAPRRTVTVTPVFEAVTGRMLATQAGSEEALVSIGGVSELEGKQKGDDTHPNDKNKDVARVGHPTALKTRTKEVGFAVVGGSTATLLESLEAGAAGGILAFASCAPQACQEVYLAWKDRDRKLAEEKQLRIAAASQRIVGQLGINGVKYACDFNGYYGGRGRAPLVALTGSEKAEIEGLLAGIRN